MPLHRLQQDLQAHLLNGSVEILPHIAQAPPLSPQSRLAIYRNAYVSRLTEALRSSFGKLHQVLGDEVFAAAAAAFIAERPSRTRSIRWFGHHLADFLARTAPYEAQPIVAELARVEWALTEVFDAGDASSLRREDLLQTAPQHWGELTFTFHPSVRTLSLAWNTTAVWQSLDAGLTAPAPQKSAAAVTWLLWRQNLQNHFRSVDAVEATALAWAMDGAPFAQVCEQLRHLLAEEQIPMQAAALVAAWADSGILIMG